MQDVESRFTFETTCENKRCSIDNDEVHQTEELGPEGLPGEERKRSLGHEKRAYNKARQGAGQNFRSSKRYKTAATGHGTVDSPIELVDSDEDLHLTEVTSEAEEVQITSEHSLNTQSDASPECNHMQPSEKRTACNHATTACITPVKVASWRQPRAAGKTAGNGQQLHGLLMGLPPLITERVQVLRGGHVLQRQSHSSFVLYWMKTAIRGHENPALDVAKSQAARLGLPLLVASFIIPHRYANTRRVKFMLEGLRDAQKELRSQGGELHMYVRHMSQPSTIEGCAVDASSHVDGNATWNQDSQLHLMPEWQALMSLAKKAALVITEDMPVQPDINWLEAMTAPAAEGGVPGDIRIWLVDTACVVPMQLTKKAYETAGPFRSATAGLRQARIKAMYSASPTYSQHAAACQWGSLDALGLPWHSCDLTDPAINLELVAASTPSIDTSVPGVQHMVGGSVAGYARWSTWLTQGGLQRYASTRNNPMKRAGASRMSAYLHWGMVSPFRLAREAAARSCYSTNKFLDELLTWREVAYHFCFHRHKLIYSPAPDLEKLLSNEAQQQPGNLLGPLAAIPKWARDTLISHAGDSRPAKKSAQQLEHGTTGDGVWDAMQRQLVRTGELHNNCRMTWGKAFIGWTASPVSAVQMALYLNHKYALDGCDPASYGGILWCFGLFDRPKAKATTPISGSLATKSTVAYSKKINVQAYEKLLP